MFFSIFGSMHTDTATVIAVSKTRVRVAINPPCLARSECKGCTLCAVSPRVVKLNIAVASSARYTPGQTVSVRRFVAHETASALFLFVMPLILAFLSIGIVHTLSVHAPSTAMTIGAFTAGCIAGIAVCVVFDAFLRYANPPSADHIPKSTCGGNL